MANAFRRVAPVGVGLILIACSSAPAIVDEPVGPRPAEPSVFESSSETKRDLGVTTWGFDDTGDTAVFHGYDTKNAQVLELTESVEETSDPFTKRITMKMT